VIFASPSFRREWRWRGLIFACAIAATLPLAVKGDSCGQDFDFHLQSWLAVAQQWHHGVFYPRWIQGANYGAGEPRFVFYPPFSWMLGALLGTILPWKAAPFAFTLIVLTASGLSMNKLASRWLSPNAAAAAACAYILNPYCLFVAYERTAYGELAAGIWLPLIVLYALLCARNNNRTLIAITAQGKSAVETDLDPHKSFILSEPPQNVILSEAEGRMNLRFSSAPTNLGAPHPAPGMWVLPNDIMPLALAIAAIWLTNAPAAVMASYTVAAITLWIAIDRRKGKAILPAAASYLLGVGLASFYLIPAAYERRWVEITRAIGPGMRFSDSFIFEHTGQSYHDQVLRTASWVFVAMLIAIVTAGAISWNRRHLPFLITLFAAAAILLALQLPPSSFLWNHAPELQFLQFPWRWALVLSVVLAISLGVAIKIPTGNQLQQTFALQIILTLAAAIALAALAAHYFYQPCDEEDAVSAQLAAFRSGGGFEGTDEYTALGADNSLMQQGLPAVRVLKDPRAEIAQPIESDTADQQNPTYAASAQDQLPARIAVETWQAETRLFSVTTQSPGYAVLRLIDYPAWRVRVNGAEAGSRPHRDDGLMAIPIPSGTTRIEVTYAATRDVLWGRGVSLVSLLALLALAAASRKRRTVGYYD
jgi:hypothetical protein